MQFFPIFRISLLSARQSIVIHVFLGLMRFLLLGLGFLNFGDLNFKLLNPAFVYISVMCLTIVSTSVNASSLSMFSRFNRLSSDSGSFNYIT